MACYGLEIPLTLTLNPPWAESHDRSRAYAWVPPSSQMTGGASWLHMCIHHRETEGFLSSATGLDKLIAAAMVF